MKVKYNRFFCFFLCILLFISFFELSLANEADNLFDRGLDLFDQGQYEKAIKEFYASMEAEPLYSYDCYYHIALCYECMEDFDNGLKFYNESLKYTDEPSYMADSYLGLGYCYFGKGDYGNAEKELVAAFEGGTAYKYLCAFKLGLCYNYQEKYHKAIDYFEKALDYADNNYDLAETHFYLGYCYCETGDLQKSNENYIKSNNYGPDANTYYNLALNYEDQGKTDPAIEAYEEYLKLGNDPDLISYAEERLAALTGGNVSSSNNNDLSDVDLGYQYYGEGAYEDAIKIANKILSQDPKNADAHYILAICYDDQGDMDKAIEEYNNTINADPTFASAYYYCGLIYVYQLGDYDKAISYLEDYATHAYYDYDKGLANFELGNCYFDLEDYRKAGEYYKKTLKYIPDDGLTYYNLGAAYYNLGEYDTAAGYYKKYIEVEPTGDYVSEAQDLLNRMGQSGSTVMSAEDHFLQGADYHDQGLYEEAKAEYLQALEIDPNHLYAHNDLGVIYYNIDKDYAKAAYHFLATLEIDPDYSLANYNVALIYEKQGRYEEAIEKYKRYLELDPTGPYSQYSQQSIEELSSMVATAPTPTPEPVVVSNNPPVIEIVEPASLIGQKNLVLEETSPLVTTIRLVGVVSDDDKVVKVTVNGQPVELSIPSTKNVEVLNSKGINKYQFAALVGLATGENIIEVKAWDSSDNIGEAQVAINYTPDMNVAENPVTTGSASKGEKWAVVIGIGNYSDGAINSLNYTVADAQSIHNFLITKGGFKSDHIKLLINEDATTKNIKSALGQFLSRKAMKNDTVFIYYSGHGAPEPDPSSTDGDGMSKYIVTYDTDPEDLYSTAFPMEEIRRIFQRIEADRIVFFIDACYSGASGGKTFSRPGMKAGNVSEKFLDDMAEGEGRIVITASGTNEVSLETADLGHGVFTYYLLEGLQGAADANSDSMITVDEAYDYLFEKVVRTSKEYGGGQHPMKKGESSGRFVIIKL